MQVSDEVLYELFKEREYSDIFEHECISDSKVNVKILPCEQSVSSDEEQNVTDNSSMQHCIWAKSGAERHFQFTGKPGINVDSRRLTQKMPVTTWNILSCFVQQILQKEEPEKKTGMPKIFQKKCLM